MAASKDDKDLRKRMGEISRRHPDKGPDWIRTTAMFQLAEERERRGELAEPPTAQAPTQDSLDLIGDEYLKLAPKLEEEMEMSELTAWRMALLRALQRRRKRGRHVSTRMSQLNAALYARGVPSEELYWEDTIGRLAYGEMALRLQLYRADLAIAKLKLGSKRVFKSYDRMEAGAIAAFEEVRARARKLLRADYEPGDELADGGRPHIVVSGNEKQA